MSQAGPTETELKLLVPPGSRARIERHPLLREAGTPEERDEQTVYFDTPLLGLARKGLSLRVRRSGQKHVQTLKSAATRPGLAGPRGEWEWPVQGDAPDLARISETPFADDVLAEAASGLETVFQTRIKRTVRHLHLPGGTLVEAAFDEGEVSSGARAQTVSELELELKGGTPAALYQLAAELHGLGPVTIGAESKAERGRRLRTGEPPAAKETTLSIAPDATAADAARAIIAAQLGHLVANQQAAASGDIEGVHQMRVGIRRLRTVLALFEKQLDPNDVAPFEGELKRLGQVFGQARDWDVFCTEILPSVPADGWTEALHQAAEIERETAHRVVQAELASPALTALILSLAAWAENSAWSGTALRARAHTLAPVLLDRMGKRVRRRGGHLSKQSVEERHRLRKAMKKLRYSSEWFASLYSAKSFERSMKTAKHLLKLLGAGNDTHVAISLADQLCATRPELRAAASKLFSWSDGEMAVIRRKLPDAWGAFQAQKPFWH